eukprot:gnl/TRDRNA2_/TRDRNA2_193460_c0_seq1.p1 gnl/TRDRNA2_/TRDRNA2_193460_c0~~gnl/TRDRNA2_/TRDRNA2_193460_c0_seq1.p1  ORF type:complete len:565 (-),score=82.83 gnl/TRDRNA2_/TRDRNA2_193460_c0_seq1:235-1929(-)
MCGVTKLFVSVLVLQILEGIAFERELEKACEGLGGCDEDDKAVTTPDIAVMMQMKSAILKVDSRHSRGTDRQTKGKQLTTQQRRPEEALPSMSMGAGHTMSSQKDTHGTVHEHGGGRASIHASNAQKEAEVSLYLLLLQNSESIAIGVLSMGIVCVSLAFVYMLNHSNIVVRKSAWKTLTCMISVLCAALIFAVIKDLMVLVKGDTPWDKGVENTQAGMKDLVRALVRFVPMFFATEAGLFRLRESESRAEMWGMFGAHLLAFAAIDTCTTVQKILALGASWPWGLAAAGASALGIFCLCNLASFLRYVLCTCIDDRRLSWHSNAWYQQCKNTEVEFSSISLGFVLSVALQRLILGYLPPIHGLPKGVEQMQVMWLLITAALITIGVMLVTALLPVSEQQSQRSWFLRLVQLVHLVASMTAAFCFLFWCQWKFLSEDQSPSEQMTARMWIALIVSGLVFQGVFVLKFLSRANERPAVISREIVSIFGVLLGFPWYGIYEQSAEGIGSMVKGEIPRALVDIVVRAGLCAFVLPAWALYMFPRTIDKKAEDVDDIVRGLAGMGGGQ